MISAVSLLSPRWNHQACTRQHTHVPVRPSKIPRYLGVVLYGLIRRFVIFPSKQLERVLVNMRSHIIIVSVTLFCILFSFGVLVPKPKQFGQPDKAMPSHGVARTATWKLSEEQTPAVDGHVKVGDLIFSPVHAYAYVCASIYPIQNITAVPQHGSYCCSLVPRMAVSPQRCSPAQRFQRLRGRLRY